MRIVIDLQGAQTASRFRGIGRYTMALTRGMLRHAGSHEIWIVLNGALEESVIQLRADLAGLMPQERIRVFETPGRIAEMDERAGPRCRAAEMLREQFIALLAPDIVLVTSLFEGFLDDAVGSVGTFIDGARTAVILYDLIPLLNPDTYLGSSYLQQCYMRKIASLKRAGLLLSISDHAREEAIGALGLEPERVVAISTAVDESFAPAVSTQAELEAVRRRFGVTRAMVMCAPGGYDPRKNIPGLVTAWSLLPAAIREHHQLVIASRLADADSRALLAHAARCGLAQSELVLTGYVCDADLIRLYQAATLFVFPSLHEGFGLPVLEAMACGAPTIGSNSTSIPEVIGLETAMFDPRDPRAIAAKIAEVLGDPATLAGLQEHGQRQATRFSWDNTAQRALRALEAQAAACPPVRPRPQAEVLDALARLPGLASDDMTMLQLASCLAAMPDLAAPRQFLVDIGAFIEPPASPSLLRRLVPAAAGADAGESVAAVSLSQQGGVWHYRYAGKDAASLAGVPAHPCAGQVADLRSGDLLLSALPSSPARAANEEGLFAHLRRIGIELHVVHLAEEVRPDAADAESADAGILSYASRIINAHGSAAKMPADA